MRNRLMGSAIALVAVLAPSSVAFAQNGQQREHRRPQRPRTSLLTRMICPDFGTSPTSGDHLAP